MESAKAFAILLHMMKGTPYIYQGEEIGMTNNPITDIREVDDIESRNFYFEELKKGEEPKEILKKINTKGRDNARTPMQWDQSVYAGFTDAEEPWLDLNPRYREINVEQALEDKQSIFYTYKKLIGLRKENKSIVFGEFKLLLSDHPTIFAYEREYQEEKWIVVANLSREEQVLDLDIPTKEIKLILSNYNKETVSLNKSILEPFEAFVVKQ